MNISKTVDGGKCVLAFDGRLDTTTAPEHQDELLDAIREHGDVTLDFADLVYVSSAGLRFLLAGQKLSEETGGRMALVHVSDEIMEVFDMTGFVDILAIEG